MSKDEDDIELPIESLEDFIKRQKLVDWPLTLTEYVQSPTLSMYNSAEEIEEYLRAKVPFPVDIATYVSTSIDELDGRVTKINSIFSKSASHTKRGSMADTEVAEDPFKEIIEKVQKQLKEEVEAVPFFPDVMEFEYPGLSALHDTEIPGMPSVSLHLERISDTQGFNPGFLKIWKPFFLSECSITVFKDMFWWFFLHSFKPNVEDESALFDCMATGFVSLLLMVDNNLKDKLFKVYADCIAQAIYSAFCEAFPPSLERLGDDFKTVLTETTSLWVSGVKPKILSWKNWKLSWLTAEKDTKTAKKKTSICDFHADMREQMSSLLRPTQTPTSSVDRRSCGEVSLGAIRRHQESHYIGPGPQFDHIYFMPWGQSPLVARYLQIHAIPSVAGASSRKVKRTEIATVPPSKPTYQEVLHETQGKIDKMRQNYKQFIQTSDWEVSLLHRTKLKNIAELRGLRKQLMGSRAETKIFSEGIVSRWAYNAEMAKQKRRLQSSLKKEGDSSDKNRNAEEGGNAHEGPKLQENPSEHNKEQHHA
ncbi:protein FAM227B-like [Engraulis encrasicolus]|uniref:protein FAM227B-like n=1 Tax=Engraulis encrasicolus TaxID=184585 RepID=UPI002FCEC378